MLYTLAALLLFNFASGARASIFGDDDRVDFYQIKNEQIREMSKSAPALIPLNFMEKLPSGDFKLKGKSLQDTFNFCPDAKFSTQPLNANCSSALIGKDILLTAGHCLGDTLDQAKANLDAYYVVFDYSTSKPGAKPSIISKENVFKLNELMHFDFDLTMRKTAVDLAVIKLDRAPKRRPLLMDFAYDHPEGDEVVILGYPLGLPQKLASNGRIERTSKVPNSFRHDLDTFSVNSGSPVFNKNGHIVGVHVRGTGSNFLNSGRSCVEWDTGIRGSDYGEANTLAPLKGKF